NLTQQPPDLRPRRHHTTLIVDPHRETNPPQDRHQPAPRHVRRLHQPPHRQFVFHQVTPSSRYLQAGGPHTEGPRTINQPNRASHLPHLAALADPDGDGSLVLVTAAVVRAEVLVLGLLLLFHDLLRAGVRRDQV